MDTLIQDFVAERNVVLASLDEARIREFYARYGEVMPPDPEVFWAGIHKAITAVKAIDIEIRRKSKAWLIQRSYSSMDDGDL
jgi:hypothetical protein